MTRIPYPDPAALSDATRQALDAIPPPTVFRFLSTAAGAFPAFLRRPGGRWSEAGRSPPRRERVTRHAAPLPGAAHAWRHTRAAAPPRRRRGGRQRLGPPPPAGGRGTNNRGGGA